LLDYSANAPAVVARAYRAVLGLSSAECSDADALDRILTQLAIFIVSKL